MAGFRPAAAAGMDAAAVLAAAPDPVHGAAGTFPWSGQGGAMPWVRAYANARDRWGTAGPPPPAPW
ncbi:exported hypothetical protein [uncultured Stenotrophomonas sp.]|uniref:Uncharacterized protein n=1 Tax=uncultured Stenotrophomonas sp. TaxID=165438 RepID=A0A1Y5QB00_9GAMM|nr:exported hypothetical protein [uncultured Stenotrophomonas sp.]